MNLSISSLAEKTGADRRSIKKWLSLDNPKTEEEAIAIITAHKSKKVEPDEANIDPKTGLTWFQAKQKEEVLEKRRENRIADKLEDKTYMLSADHHAILASMCSKLEQIPAKAKSEMGLSESHRAKLQRMIDEARDNTAQTVAKEHDEED